MASVLGRAIQRCRLPARRSVLHLQGSRSASSSAGAAGAAGGVSTNAVIFAGGLGVLGISTYAILQSRRKQSLGFNTKVEAERVKEYAKITSTHPEAEAEKLIATKVIPDTPESKPIVSTEVMAEAPPTKRDAAKLALPSHVTYVLIGAGTASFAAAKAIREKDPRSKVLIIGEEEFTPYSRPPLSKQLWLYEDHAVAKQLKFKAAWSGGKLVDPFYKWSFCDPKELALKEEGGVAVLTNAKATKLNPMDKKVTLDSGVEISFDKCLLATGGSPRNLPVFSESPNNLKEKVSLYRGIHDYQKLDDLVGKVESVLVVGGGFLGSELAVGMASRGKSRGLAVTQLFPEEGNLGLVLPTNLCKWTMDKVRKEGVTVLPETTVSKVALSEGGRVLASLSNGSEVEVDHVVVAVGLQPNTDLADSAGLEVDPLLGGYRVNAELQACTDVWAAGDASCFFDPKLGRRRVEHHDHANVSGRLAGENMAGGHRRFDHQSMFWSDLGSEVGFEATGLIDGKLPTVGVWAKSEDESEMPVDDFSKGVVFYLSDETGRILGVLTWNLFGKMDVAKQVIAEEKRETDIGEIIGKFSLHKPDKE